MVKPRVANPAESLREQIEKSAAQPMLDPERAERLIVALETIARRLGALPLIETQLQRTADKPPNGTPPGGGK